jgi:glutamine amidotransferase
MIIVVDYGMGNVGAIANMLEYLGFDARVTRDTAAIEKASRLILPGVGAFDRAMKSLRAMGLVKPLEEAALGRRVPVLGVCLGMQLLGKRSQEGGGEEAGLGWIDGETRRLSPTTPSIKIPHIGWTEIAPSNGSPLFVRAGAEPRFYFVHSFALHCESEADVAATSDYGGRFCCAVSHENVHGVQFHPEKSHRFGMQLFRDFVERT